VSRGAIRVLLAASVAALLLVAGTAGARLTPSVGLKVSKHRDGPYDLVTAVNVPLGQSKSVYFKGKNNLEENLEATFDDDGSSSGLENFAVKWFRGHRNITSDVKGGGYDFTLKPDKQAIFRAKLTHNDPGDGFCLEANLSVPSTVAFSGVSVNQKCSF
jgi:hypothetical protein